MQCKNKCGNETIQGRQVCEVCNNKDLELMSSLKNIGVKTEPKPEEAQADEQISFVVRSGLVVDRGSNTYTCCMCKEVFEKGWSDDEALEETESNFGDIPEDELDIVCDDCYKELGLTGTYKI